MKKIIITLIAFTFFINSCKKKADEPCTVIAGTTVASVAEELLVTTYLSNNGITTAVELENSGMFYTIEAAGNTKKPTQCNTISVKYVGKLISGVSFDPSPSSGLTVSTANFQLGRLIEGWKRALPLVGEGGKMKLYIPPALGYGAAGLQNPNTGVIIIPANQIIIFDMELTAVN